jgi:hypothetical protein
MSTYMLFGLTMINADVARVTFYISISSITMWVLFMMMEKIDWNKRCKKVEQEKVRKYVSISLIHRVKIIYFL